MTDEQVIEKLSERLDVKPFHNRDFLNSRDDLAGVLEGLSDDEWKKLHDKLWGAWFELHFKGDESLNARSAVYNLLTLPPRDLAHAIAEVI